jgi:hypothetical protein
MNFSQVDPQEILRRAVRYVIEGFAVALAAFYIPRTKMSIREVTTIAITAAATFALLDVLAPNFGDYVRQGMGIGIGFSQTRF